MCRYRDAYVHAAIEVVNAPPVEQTLWWIIRLSQIGAVRYDVAGETARHRPQGDPTRAAIPPRARRSSACDSNRATRPLPLAKGSIESRQ
jgi:hypothetical protein